jgi:hypothetical protein
MFIHHINLLPKKNVISKCPVFVKIHAESTNRESFDLWSIYLIKLNFCSLD